MSLNQTHPLYDEMVPDWELMRVSYKGEKAVKEAGTKYLPATPGQVLDGMNSATDPGRTAYDSYKVRAVYPDFVQVGVETLIGILNAKETIINLPPQMEYLRERCTLEGEKLSAIIRKIHEEQLVSGRLGLLADLPTDPDQKNPQLYLLMYKAEKVLNWDDGGFNQGFNKLNLVVIDESGFERKDTFNWVQTEKYRVLSLGNLSENEPIADYKAGTFGTSASKADDVSMITPTLRGKTLDEIPFVFISAKDNVVAPEPSPLLGLARHCMTIYRAEADYRYTLYMQGQDTLVVLGGLKSDSNGDTLRIGAGARIDIEVGGDAKYIGIGAGGLPEQRTSLQADRNQAAVRTGQLLAPGKMSMESGEALKTRVAAQTATLTSVANAAAAGLERILRIMAKWHNADPLAVKVIPNLDFTNVAIQGQDLVQLVTAKNLGYPVSYQTLFAIAAERGLSKNTFEEEVKLIESDPKSLVDRAQAMLNPPQANNAQASAGGPKKSTEGVKPKGNTPAK